MSDVPVTPEVMAAFESNAGKEEPVNPVETNGFAAATEEAVAKISTIGPKECPICGGSKAPQADRCRKCFFDQRRLAVKAVKAHPQTAANTSAPTVATAPPRVPLQAKPIPAPSEAEAKATLLESAVMILAETPSWMLLPLLRELSPDDRELVEQALLSCSHGGS